MPVEVERTHHLHTLSCAFAVVMYFAELPVVVVVFKYNASFLIFCSSFDELVINISHSCSRVFQFFKSLMITEQIGLNSALLPLLIITMLITALYSLISEVTEGRSPNLNRGHVEN